MHAWPKILSLQLKGIKNTLTDANLNLDLDVLIQKACIIKEATATCDFYFAKTTDQNKTRKRNRTRSQWPWKSTEINGTFMRYQMTHQIHLAAKTPQDLAHVSLSLAVLVIACHSPCCFLWLGQSYGTHLHLPLGQPLLSGPLANVIRVTSLEGYSGHGPLTKADLPTNSPSQPASTSLFKVLKKNISYLFRILPLRDSLTRKDSDL